MRLRIAHSIIHRYEPPAAAVIQVLRLTSRNHEGQYVIDWRIDVSGDTRLNAHEDAFGNLTHVFAADGPFAELSINVEGTVETQNTGGIVRGTLTVAAVTDGTKGELEFESDPQPPKLLLDFDPRGQAVEVRQGQTIFLTVTIPS